LMLRMKMRRSVFSVIHADHDAEEYRDDRHRSSIASSVKPAGGSARSRSATVLIESSCYCFAARARAVEGGTCPLSLM
jgi:hypothetical protein